MICNIVHGKSRQKIFEKTKTYTIKILLWKFKAEYNNVCFQVSCIKKTNLKSKI